MSEIQRGAWPTGHAFVSALNLVLTSMNTIGSLWIFALMVMIDVDAFSRTLFNRPFHGVLELVELSIVGIVFLQLGDATRRGRLTRSDGFFNIVRARKPMLHRVMGAVFDLLGALFLAIVLVGAVPEMIDAWVLDYYVGDEGVFTAPEWPVKLIIVLGCFVTLLQFLAFAARYLRPGAWSEPEPQSAPSGE
ncbi:MAG: TRAP transporter small permease [Rhodospirillales bacterium]|nr:TRAP transporter small permease [Rhodospirillales bacterium]MDP6646186.1 TRAP transporter small permease [Rhodospirillales bacterium]MDP6841290.1 TRAP transporter small permease [Rhodospirillales bacterium]